MYDNVPTAIYTSTKESKVKYSSNPFRSYAGKAFSVESLVKVLSNQIHVACMGDIEYSS